MDYEIDFLPVGSGERSGDAICLRFRQEGENTWYVGVIDGGTKDSGEKLCEHIRQFYNTETVDFLICTHPDQDHASGLSVVIEELDVLKVIMHCPWEYVDHIFPSVDDGRVTKGSLKQSLIEGHPYAYAVYEKAIEKRIPIHHAFSESCDFGIPHMNIVGPSAVFYLQQVVNFRSITDVTEDRDVGLLDSLRAFGNKLYNFIAESWDNESLLEPEVGATSAENLSSVITFFDFGGNKALFTADAGVEALDQAADKIEALGHGLEAFSFFQVPHHGSRRNIGPEVLDRLVGPAKLFGQNAAFSAFISAAPEGAPKHPNKKVINALTRRGAQVLVTRGGAKYFYSTGLPLREGYGRAIPEPFYDQVEDDD